MRPPIVFPILNMEADIALNHLLAECADKDDVLRIGGSNTIPICKRIPRAYYLNTDGYNRFHHQWNPLWETNTLVENFAAIQNDNEEET